VAVPLATAIALILLWLAAAPAGPSRVALSAGHDDARLLETGGRPHPTAPAPHAADELKVVSYNMRWRGGEDLQKLIGLLRDDGEIGRAAIIGLQEVDRHKKRTDGINAARVMAESLGMHYAWAAPPRINADQEEDETGVAILSRYPLADVTRIVLPHEGPGGRRRVALGATARVGAAGLRIYSVHAETRIACEKKMDQLRAVLADLDRYPHTDGAIVLGDFNTIKGKDVRAARELFTGREFTTPFPDDDSTWKTFIIKLKLDWIWLRRLRPTASGITRRITLSDHWPLWVNVSLPTGDRKVVSSF